ncbi:hypothetical protein Nizo2259_0031 [Lactiplantibacillus plantarum]|nr:hypothetical protein LpDm1_1468 [Lactiplantibacillus plantarum]KZU00461.1 hypothetical protein Nizo2259_0031 [Lactiplantibacillus plantarum]KZU20185.1 hypothetical protein Nizo2457_0197 [Lactiplantibacillus plantarum]KZU28251.1 hypothetical protein Nizo2494_1307 [Lactiplantibacillus plantarum]
MVAILTKKKVTLAHNKRNFFYYWWITQPWSASLATNF